MKEWNIAWTMTKYLNVSVLWNHSLYKNRFKRLLKKFNLSVSSSFRMNEVQLCAFFSDESLYSFIKIRGTIRNVTLNYFTGIFVFTRMTAKKKNSVFFLNSSWILLSFYVYLVEEFFGEFRRNVWRISILLF